MSNVIDEVNKEMYDKMIHFVKAALRDISTVLKEIEKAQDRKERQALIEQLQNKIKEYDKELAKYQEMLNPKEQNKTPDKIDFNKPIDFKKVCPDTFQEMQKTLIETVKREIDIQHKVIINTVDEMQGDYSTEQKEQFITNKLNETDINKLCEKRITGGNMEMNVGLFTEPFFRPYRQNEDMKNLINEYLHNEYENTDISEYLEYDKIDFNKLIDDTEIDTDIMESFANQVINDTGTQSELKLHLAKAKAEHGDIDDLINGMEEFVKDESDTLEKSIKAVEDLAK